MVARVMIGELVMVARVMIGGAHHGCYGTDWGSWSWLLGYCWD